MTAQGPLARRLSIALAALLVLLALATMMGAMPFQRSYACGSGRRCGTILVRGGSTDTEIARWLSSEVRAHPRCTDFRLKVRRWSLASLFDEDTDDIVYNVPEQRVDDTQNDCGCNGGWTGVTPDKLHTLVARHLGIFDLDKLGCPGFP